MKVRIKPKSGKFLVQCKEYEGGRWETIEGGERSTEEEANLVKSNYETYCELVAELKLNLKIASDYERLRNQRKGI